MSDVIVTSLSNLKNEVRYGDNHTLITGGVTSAVLPHHRTNGSVYGGS